MEHGADINVRDSQGYTPIIGAIGVLSFEKVLLFQHYGASVNVRNETNFVTSLMAAVTGEHMDLVNLCLHHGCNVHDKDKVTLSHHPFLSL